MKHPLTALLVFLLGACVPPEPPDAPDPPPAPTDAHCSESCEQLQALGCKRGSDAVCAEFDDAGECVETQDCVSACQEAPHAYPRGVIEECP